MGRSIRTNRYRYTEWAREGEEPLAVELYDLSQGGVERVNLAAGKADRELLAELSGRLRAGGRAALPEGFGARAN